MSLRHAEVHRSHPSAQPPTTCTNDQHVCRLLRAEEEAYSLSLGDQGPWESDIVRLVYSSLVTPTSTFDVNVRTGKTIFARSRNKTTNLHNLHNVKHLHAVRCHDMRI